MAIKGILFDKDGVLVDFQKTYAPSTVEVIEALAVNDEKLALNLAAAVNFDLEAVRFDAGSVVIAGTAADIAEAWHPFLPRWQDRDLILKVEALYDEFTVKNVTPFGDVGQSLRSLRNERFKIGLATNDTQESAHRHLEAIGQKNAFDFIAGYDSGHGAKPGPGMILAFASVIGCTPEEVIMVGDSTHDMIAGKAASAECVAVTTGLASAEALKPYADHIVRSLTELVDLVSDLRRL